MFSLYLKSLPLGGDLEEAYMPICLNRESINIYFLLPSPHNLIVLSPKQAALLAPTLPQTAMWAMKSGRSQIQKYDLE